MALPVGALLDALEDAGASREKAGKAAEELAGYGTRLPGIDAKLSGIDARLAMLTWTVGINAAVSLAVLAKLFTLH